MNKRIPRDGEKNGRILIVEDEMIARENLEHVLRREGHTTVAVENGNEALKELENADFDLILTDLRMPEVDGMQLLDIVRERCPETETLLITGYATVSSAVEAMRKGAFYYLPKPYKTDELRILVDRALEKRALHQEVTRLKRRLEETASPYIIGRSPKIKILRDTISQISTAACNVLILGETGTGKELVARSIHNSSPRNDERFMAINCAGLSEELLVNELFGHEDGAFTGAKGTKKGLLESADKGTFFLDEIGDMPLSMQAKLLRVLEEKILIRVGGTKEVSVDIRILAATNKDLKKEVEEGSFRQDLFYRLNVVTLQTPALSERKEDIPVLSLYFLEKYARAMNKRIDHISEKVFRILESYEFPGNVRELENTIERAVVMCTGDTILETHLPLDLQTHRVHVVRFQQTDLTTLAENERRYITRALEAMQGNKTKTSELLGIDRVSLWRKLKRYGIVAN
ncbi:MAG: sigma-54-dependent Fis family transcriptional regulator [Proteobacteria bacterium]|nr:sigma-54-dependent Fis family transcriptional regulator [Pseudomonadota bacterium]